MRYVLAVDTGWMDTSIADYDGAIVEIVKESQGRRVAVHDDNGLPAKISLSKHCNIKTGDGTFFYNIPKSWLIEWPQKINKIN